MPFLQSTQIQFGSGVDLATSAEVGSLTVAANGSFTIAPVSGFVGGNLSFIAADRALLRNALAAALAEFDAFSGGAGTGARLWDVTDDANDIDTKTVTLNENSGTITVKSTITLTMKADTVRGLLLPGGL